MLTIKYFIIKHFYLILMNDHALINHRQKISINLFSGLRPVGNLKYKTFYYYQT